MAFLNQDYLSVAISNSINTFSELLESHLVAACHAPGRGYSPCLQAATQHLVAGGSRVRARICFDAGTRLGLPKTEALLAATACELLHNASLIQDDLLDRTPTRRGSPSIWVRHGDTVAVCTGDLMLSAAYGVLSDLSSAVVIADAVRLVHRRTSEVIIGQATEGLEKTEQQDTTSFYEQQARGKSASLLSLALELPLLLSGYSEFLSTAHSAASHFAVAYQIADDLNDYKQDTQESSLNLLLFFQRDGLTLAEAYGRACELARARLASAEDQARLLPHDCAATLLHYAESLREEITCHAAISPLAAGD